MGHLESVYKVLLFIVMGVDEDWKGVPFAFLLFSAPTGNRATHAGFDTRILTKLLTLWRKSWGGNEKGESFTSKAVITDTDIEERGALVNVRADVILLLCKFHFKQCWTNCRKKLFKGWRIGS